MNDLRMLNVVAQFDNQPGTTRLNQCRIGLYAWLHSGPRHHANSHGVHPEQIPLSRRDSRPPFWRQRDLLNVLANCRAGNFRLRVQQLPQVSQPHLNESTRIAKV